MLGQPIPEDMDGKVLIELFSEDFIKNNQIRFVKPEHKYQIKEELDYSEEESKKIEERLKGLGYLE